MKAINFVGGRRAKLVCRGLESEMEALEAELAGCGLVKFVCDDDRGEELTVPWSWLVGFPSCCVWWWDCLGVEWWAIIEVAWCVVEIEARVRILDDVALVEKGVGAAIGLAGLLHAGGKKAKLRIGLLGELLAIGGLAVVDNSSDRGLGFVFESWSGATIGSIAG